MLDSIKSINLVSAYSAKSFKDDRDLSELKYLFNVTKENNNEHANTINKKTDSVEISEEALKLLNSSKETE